jgi:cob(I)alamin adenosyltransferase
MKIYTKTGDKGETSLFGGTRVSKSHERIHAYGTIDELNSFIGLVADQEVNRGRREFLRNIQNSLFVIGSSLAADPDKKNIKSPRIEESKITEMEKEIDLMENSLEPLKAFILPGGHTSVSYCHIARCVCRRAERYTIALSIHSPVDPLIITYLNRLSDYLFVLARKMAKELNAEEIIWKH